MQDTRLFDQYQKKMQSEQQVQSQKKKFMKKEPKIDDVLKIQKFHKIQYGPQGNTDRKDRKKIPAVSACAYDEEREMLICSFVNCDTKAFFLKGFDSNNSLKT